MYFKKVFAVIILLSAIVGCSSSPSDSDINEAFNSQAMSQLDNAFAPMGFKASDAIEIIIKIENKAKQDDGRWLVQTEARMVAKKDIESFNEQQKMGLGILFGQFKKGQDIGKPQKGSSHMTKGDKGWILSN
jgi:hypothetical protein